MKKKEVIQTEKLKQYRLKRLIKKTGQTRCQICGIKAEGGKRFVAHHISYEKDITIILCHSCHCWLHGMAAVYKNRIKDEYEKDISPYEFAKRVVKLYERPMTKNKIIKTDSGEKVTINEYIFLNRLKKEKNISKGFLTALKWFIIRNSDTAKNLEESQESEK